MRDIKFRLWHKSIKQMLHFDNVIGIMDNKDRYGIFLPSMEGKMFMGGDQKLMQYTGSDDYEYPKSNPIYEGDIVSAYKHGDQETPKITNQVTFKNGSFHWGNWTWGEFLNKFRFILVVGNVFENPELLEVQK